MNRVCRTCEKELEPASFSVKNKNTGLLNTRCKKCVAENSKSWYSENKEAHIKNVKQNKIVYAQQIRSFIWGYLKDNPCVDCGEADPIVLELDHRQEKNFNLADAIDHYGLKRVAKEVSLCDVRCANCHRRKTAKQFGWLKWSISDSN